MINGYILTSEWNDANEYHLYLYDPDIGYMEFYIYLKNNADSLYVAVDAVGDEKAVEEESWRHVVFTFDVDNDGKLTAWRDKMIRCWTDEYPFDGGGTYWKLPWNGTWFVRDWYNTKDWYGFKFSGSPNSRIAHWTCEIEIPLDEFCGSYYIGLQFYYILYEVSTPKEGYEWPKQTDQFHPETYGDLKIAEGPPQPPDLTLYDPEINELTVRINGVVSPGTPGSYIERIHWDWDDGRQENHWFPSSHTYATPDTYTITVTAHQSDGLTTTRTETIKLILPILNVQPKELYFDVEKGQTKTKQITIQNDGSGELDWEVSRGHQWVARDPSQGLTTTETETVDITVDTAYLNPGHYESWVYVTSNGGNEYIDIIVDVTEKPMVELDIKFYSNKDTLKHDKTQARITLEIQNIGVVDARNLKLDIIVPEHFECSGSTHFEWTTLRPGMKKTIDRDVIAKICKLGTFQLQGTYRDYDGSTKNIYEDFRILLRDFIVTEYDEKYVDYSLSKDYVYKLEEEWYGPIQVASALWVVMAKMDLGLPPDDFDTLIENIEDLYSILDMLWKTGELPEDVLWNIFDMMVGLGLNAAGLWIDCCVMDKANDDGTLDYHSLWPLRAAKGLRSYVVDIVINAAKETDIKLPTISSYYTYFVDKEGKMYITVLADGEDVTVRWVENVALAIIDAGVNELKIIIDAKDAEKTVEEYDLLILTVRDNEIVDKKPITETIHRGEEREYRIQITSNEEIEAVRAFHDVGLDVHPSRYECKSGESVRYTVTIENLGNVRDHYNLTVEADFDIEWVYLKETSVTLDPNESKDVYVTVNTEELKISGNYILTVNATLQSDNSVYKVENVVLVIKSIKYPFGIPFEAIGLIALAAGVAIATTAIIIYRKRRKPPP